MWATRAPLWMWPALIVITVISGILRLFRLEFPGRLIFDETYYVKDSYSMITYGYERSWPENADASFNAGDPSVIGSAPAYVVHPPLGKWVIGLGIDLFGADDSFGWRFSVAVVGTLTVFLMGLVAWKLFRSAFFACAAAVLLSIDGEHFVHSRTSLLDIVLMAFILLAFWFILLDREQVTKRLARWAADTTDGVPVAARGRRSADAERADLINFGPRLGVRPWLIAAGIALGMATGVKWSGLYALAAFGILVVAWDVHSRYRAGVVHPWLGALIRDSIPSFLKLVPTALITYIATWTGWILSDDAWNRQWAAETPGWWQALPSWLDWSPSLAQYHYTAYSFHVGLDAEHPTCRTRGAGSSNGGRPRSTTNRSAAATSARGGEVLLGDHLGGQPRDLGTRPCRAPRRPRRVDRAPRRPRRGHPLRTRRDLVAVVRLPGPDDLHLLHDRHGPLRRPRARLLPHPPLGPSHPEPALRPADPYVDHARPSPPRRVPPPSRARRPPPLPPVPPRRPPPSRTHRPRHRPTASLRRRRTAGAWARAPRGRRSAADSPSAQSPPRTVLAFAYFWPIYTGEVIPFEAWNNRMWNVTWR